MSLSSILSSDTNLISITNDVSELLGYTSTSDLSTSSHAQNTLIASDSSILTMDDNMNIIATPSITNVESISQADNSSQSRSSSTINTCSSITSTTALINELHSVSPLIDLSNIETSMHKN